MPTTSTPTSGDELRSEIAKFQRLLGRLHRFGALSRARSKLLNALNPFNYVSMGTVLNLGGFSGDFRYKVLKPMFVNFLMATNVFDMPASLFSRYLEFFRHRVLHAHADVGPGDAAHLREPVRRFPGQDIPGPARPKGLSPAVTRGGRGRGRREGDLRQGDPRVQRQPGADDPGQAHADGALRPLVDTLRERAAQPHGRTLGLLCPPGRRGGRRWRRGAIT